MSLDGALRAGRRAAERLMVDTVSVAQATGELDPIEGTPARSVVYMGKGKVQTYEAQESRPESGGFQYTEQRYTVSVPVESYSPRVGDVIAVLDSPYDTHLEGREFRVVALLHKSLATAYRLGVTDGPD